ncbi:response regulator transcription factor [Paenibacillus sp. J2TS4]|uniref:response regulator transcription factor n=1 Tax=Paenibacillus sp. J2TS4 TaxID=2807194 RepID=UPI001B0FCA12|nr:response regulator transcription factor [Paenibacillus sp. J2TS4]GIP31884.1 hypothetical protein J2TS4_10940 [Paenibacillus sp. J2TS4]
MQRIEDSGGKNKISVIDDIDFEEGQLCETTRRIVIVSPQPASIRSLFVALSIRCYDVLVFHHEHDPLLLTIESDLFIVDRTLGVSSEPIEESEVNRTILYLCKPGDENNGHAHVLEWPCTIERAVEKIEKLVSRNPSAYGSQGSGELLRLKDLVVDLKRIIVRKAGSKVELTKTEFDLLKGLLLNGGGVMTREEMMSFVWGDSYFGGSNSIDVHIKSLRRKLDDNPRNPKYIATVRGVGYRIAD